ncbi:M23 family metallopeptidase [Altericista sp. CCNU0014]|uniref:M23 family metallopeptidase n=1 Tax=Altericista sp. CCNU0014 TaxID=3082949 RepID=UPI0038500154
MMDKIIDIKPKRTLDRSLISIGGWLRGIDAQIISFIRPETNTWTKQDFSQYRHRRDSDIPQWIYPDRAEVQHGGKQLKPKSWYATFKKSFAPWHTSLDWRVPFPNLSLTQNAFHRLDATTYRDGALAFSYAYAPPIHQRMGMGTLSEVQSRQFPALQLSEGLSDFWATSYKFSTALAMLLPIAVNTAQSPVISDFLAQTYRSIETRALELGRTSKATPVAPVVQLTRPVSQPARKVASIQKYILPAKGEFTSGYGMRWGRLHRGIDIAGPVGTPIVAVSVGKVIAAGWSDDGFGNKVEIQHPDGTVTLYAHASEVLTRVGIKVRQGEQIAKMGSSGFSTGPHLHFQVHPKGKTAVDPMFFFGKRNALIAAKPSP